MTDTRSSKYLEAIRHFQYARWQATLEEVLARVRGESVDLLPYDEVRRLLKAEETPRRVRKDIPLDAIVGSVGRYNDFTRSFLPRMDSDQHRWASVELRMTGMVGLPPIEVYQIGDVYFVQDGNHRVSVARQLEATYIEAYVTEVQTKVPLSPDVQPDDLILKAEMAEFLKKTRLDELRPEADLRVTVPGRYREILEHIDVHRYYMGIEQKRAVPYEEAVLHWFDEYYFPISRMIRERGLLREFPDRTRLDLYVWISKHRESLKQTLGWDISQEAAAGDIAERFSAKPERVATRVGKRLLDAVIPDALEGGPAPGTLRRAYQGQPERHRLFRDILVPISGGEEHWFALYQALQVAKREGSRVLGLHVVPKIAGGDSESVQAIQQEFYRRCAKSGVPVQFATESGTVARVICDRARWTDLTVVRLAHPPAPGPVGRLGSGIRTMLRRCGGPLLIVPRDWCPLERALVAFNGTDKSWEAMFMAAYLAGRWQMPLTVQVVEEGRMGETTLAEAQAYLAGQGLEAAYRLDNGSVVETIIAVAGDTNSDLIIMGGYTASVLAEMMQDSKVNQLLRSSRLPMLVCR